jgi:hypothetical protein
MTKRDKNPNLRSEKMVTLLHCEAQKDKVDLEEATLLLHVGGINFLLLLMSVHTYIELIF